MATSRKSAGEPGSDHHKTAGAGGPGGGGVDADTGATMASGTAAPSAGGTQDAADGMYQAGGRIVENGAAIGARVIDQAQENAHQAFEAMRAAAQAKDLADVMRIQGDYLREQGDRSMAQAREIGELIAQFGRDAVTPLKPR